MAYQALYNKYRPQTFGQVVGQKAIVRTLENSLKEGKIAHGYLFCGPRGTGKTSMARLFAKALDCKEGVGRQCLKCDSCKAVAKGNHPDVVEIDAASNSGVDNVRDLISQVNYRPMMGRYKVYIVDECHNMTEPAFNALLKTLEEPPDYVVFILCTTEPQSILPTILSRVQRFDFAKVDDKDLIGRVSWILQQEKVSFTEEAVQKVVDLSDGGVRDALSILDQAVSFGGKKIDEGTLETLFGLLDAENKIKIVRLAHEGKLPELLQLARGFYEKGMDVVRTVEELENIYKDLIIHSFGGGEELFEQLSQAQAQGLAEISREEAESDIQALLSAQRDFRYAQDLMDAFELALIKISTRKEECDGGEEERKEKAPSKVPTPEKSAGGEAVQPKPVKAEVAKGKTGNTQARKSEAPRVKEEGPIPQKEEKEPSKARRLTDEEVLNVMIQGDKELKRKFVGGWDFLDEREKDLQPLVDRLFSAKPAVAAQGALIVAVEEEEDLALLNAPENRRKLSKILSDNFQESASVAAILADRFEELVEEFKKKSKAKKLPEKKPIHLFGEEKGSEGKTEEKSNADLFLDGITKGG